MPSINRPLSGKWLPFRLGEEDWWEFLERERLECSGRSARTLVRENTLRAILLRVMTPVRR